MATVPMYDMPTQQLNAGGMTPVQAPEFQDYTGKQIAEVGKAVQTAGDAALKIGMDIQNKYDDARTKELFNKAATEIDSIRNEYLSKSGKMAVDAHGEYQNKIAEVIKGYSDQTENDVQKTMFGASSSVMARTAFNAMDAHQLTELNQYDQGERAEAIKTNGQAAISSYAVGNKEGFQTFSDAAVKEAQQLAVLKGLPSDSEQAKALVITARDGIATGVVSNLLNAGKPSQAKEYLADAVKNGLVSETTSTKLMQSVSTDAAKDTALRLSLSLKGGESVQIKTLDDMFKSGKLSQEEHDFSVQYVEHRFAEQKQQQNEYRKIMIGNAQDWILNNPGKPIAQMPTSLYNAAKNEGVLSSLDALANRDGQPANQIKNLQARGQLLQLSAQDPEEFIKRFNETGFVGEMDIGVAGIKEMQNLAMQMVQGKGAYSNGFNTKILQDAIPADLLKASNKDKKDAFVALQYESIDAWKKANPGKMPTIEDQKRVAQEANANWVQIGKVWNTEQPAYKVKSQGIANAVPVDLFNGMKQSGASDSKVLDFFNGMKKAGATDSEILAAWDIKQGKK